MWRPDVLTGATLGYYLHRLQRSPYRTEPLGTLLRAHPLLVTFPSWSSFPLSPTFSMETFPHKSLPPKSSSQGLLLGNPTKDRISFHLSLPGAPPSHHGSISSSLSPFLLPALPSAPGQLTQPPPPPPWEQMASSGQESSLRSDL